MHSIDYLNARRDAKPASGGKLYRNSVNAVDVRDAWQSISDCEQVLSELDFAIDNFRRVRAEIVRESELLLQGESFDELTF